MYKLDHVLNLNRAFQGWFVFVETEVEEGTWLFKSSSNFIPGAPCYSSLSEAKPSVIIKPASVAN